MFCKTSSIICYQRSAGSVRWFVWHVYRLSWFLSSLLCFDLGFWGSFRFFFIFSSLSQSKTNTVQYIYAIFFLFFNSSLSLARLLSLLLSNTQFLLPFYRNHIASPHWEKHKHLTQEKKRKEIWEFLLFFLAGNFVNFFSVEKSFEFFGVSFSWFDIYIFFLEILVFDCWGLFGNQLWVIWCLDEERLWFLGAVMKLQNPDKKP